MEYCIKNLPKEEIKSFLQMCDKNFTPPLSEKVNLETYSEKLANNAQHFCLYDGFNIIGLSCCYCNAPDKKVAYISVTCIHPNYLRKGFGQKLTNFLEHEIKLMNFNKIRFEVEFSNIASQKMHESIGYRIVEKIGNSYYMEKKLIK